MRKTLSIGLVLAMLGLMAALSGSLAGVAAAQPLHAVTDTPTSTPVTPTDTPTSTPVTPTNTPTSTPVTLTRTPETPGEPPASPTPTPPALLPETGSGSPDVGSVLAIVVLAMLGLGAIEFVMARRRTV